MCCRSSRKSRRRIEEVDRWVVGGSPGERIVLTCHCPLLLVIHTYICKYTYAHICIKSRSGAAIVSSGSRSWHGGVPFHAYIHTLTHAHTYAYAHAHAHANTHTSRVVVAIVGSDSNRRMSNRRNKSAGGGRAASEHSITGWRRPSSIAEVAGHFQRKSH